MVDAEEQFLTALAGVTDPETKRKIIGREFIRTFEQAQAEILRGQGASSGARATRPMSGRRPPPFSSRARSTPTWSSPAAARGAANIKSHHNVGGLPETSFELVEPLRTLFKDEVRAVGTELGLPDEIVRRQPFRAPASASASSARSPGAWTSCAPPTRSLAPS